MKISQKGFSIIEVLVVIIVVSALVGIGYVAYGRISDNKAPNNISNSTVSPEQAEIADINTVDDLDKTNDVLNELDTESSTEDLDQLDEALNTF